MRYRILLLALFVRSQINNRRCLLNMGLFKNWAFSGSCLAAFMNYAASFSISFFLALYLQSIGGLSSTEAGLLMIVQPVVLPIGAITSFLGAPLFLYLIFKGGKRR